MRKENFQKGETDEKTASLKTSQGRKIVVAFVLVLVVVAAVILVVYLLGGKGQNNSESMDIAKEEQQFRYKNRNYTVLSGEKRDAFGLPESVQEGDIGEKIGTISEGPLEGTDFYEYLPAGGQAVVAVQKEDQFFLYEFYAFQRYLDNQDEDVVSYLSLYGITDADSIEKVQFITLSQEAGKSNQKVLKEITSPDDIRTFYNRYSVMTDSSKQYFDQIYGQSGSVGQKDYTINLGGSLGSPSQGQGTTLLDDAVLIRIVSKTGIFMDAPYYPGMGFISRHKVTDEFADFLKQFISK